MVGIVKDFKNWAKLKTPILLTANGFMINGRRFMDKSDAFRICGYKQDNHRGKQYQSN